MYDPRLTALAKILTTYSISAKQNDKVVVQVSSPLGLPLAREVYKQLINLGAFPYLDLRDEGVSSYYFNHATKKQLKQKPEISSYLANWADRAVIIVADENTRELASANEDSLLIRAKVIKPIRELMLKKPWVLTYFPTYAMAQDANMAYEDFVDFFFASCIKDWKKEQKRLKKLASYLQDAKDIHVLGEDTDLRLSAKGRIFVVDDGKNNMPGGEVFTAPVDTSVEGYVYFNFPLLRQGKMIRDIRLWFHKGKVIKASASENQNFLHRILDTDIGARTLGEFAIGANSGIQRYMYNVLFDEKIQGTIHMALGDAYKDCGGINTSAIHMDIIKDMKSKGSSVSANGKIVLQNGKLIV